MERKFVIQQSAVAVRRSAEQVMTAGRDRLFVRLAGNEGPPIVLLHGLASSSRYWAPGAPLLGREHRLLMPDLLGFGRSPKPFTSDYSAAEHVAWLHRTLLPLAGGPFTLVGQSMGSLLALDYAVAHPECVSSLALISLPVIGCLPWGHRVNGEPRRLHRLVAHTRLGSRLAGWAIRLATPIGWYLAPRIQRDVPLEAARDSMRVTAASYWRTLERIVYGTDVPDLVDRLDRPLLVIQGADDHTAPLDPVRELVTARPRIRLEIVAGAGHNPYVSHTARVVDLIDGYVSQAGF